MNVVKTAEILSVARKETLETHWAGGLFQRTEHMASELPVATKTSQATGDESRECGAI